MTTRVLCLWFPNWAVQRRWRPALRNRPVVLFAEGPRGRRVSACCGAAARHGVKLGMPVAEAEALWSRPPRGAAPACFLPADPHADREALRELAWECEAFSPLVGLEESDAPDCLLLDITGCTPLFESEHALGREIMASMAGQGWQCRAAVADTVGAAWALARYGTRGREPLVTPRGEQTSALTPLPAAALRLPADVLARLRRLDIRTVGELLSLPRSSLPSRFGPQLLLRLDQALGEREERIVPERRPSWVEASWAEETALGDALALETVLQRLVTEILDRLQQQGQGVERLVCLLSGPGGEVARLSVELLRPTLDARHVMELLRLQLERMPVGTGISRVTLRASKADRLPIKESLFWEHEDRSEPPQAVWPRPPCLGEEHSSPHRVSMKRVAAEQSRAFDKLIEQLSSHFGTAAVLQPQCTEEELPELASGDVPYVACHVEQAASLLSTNELQPSAGEQAASLPPHGGPQLVDAEQAGSLLYDRTVLEKMSCLTRPLWLKRSPEPVRVESATDEGPPARFHWREREHAVVHSWGPERITTGWWRGSHVRRDYYHVETTCGRRFWLFRELVSGEWFLHAAFD